MQYRVLGKTGLKVSEIGCGTWPIGGGWGQQDDRADIASLHRALDQGVNFFDSAMGYGNGHSEEVVGQAFKDRRHKIILATKISPKADPDGPVHESYPADWIIQCTERSLQRFGTDYLDLQQIHCWRDHYTESDEWHDALIRLRDQGKIRCFGVSSGDWDSDGAVRLVQRERTASVQVIFNLFEQRPTEHLFPAALQHGTGIIARVPLEEGLLTGSIRADHQWAEGDWRGRWMTPERIAEVHRRLEAMRPMLTAERPTFSALALKYCLSHPAVSTVIVGMRNAAHVNANCALSDGRYLTKEEFEQMQAHAFHHGWFYPWDQRLAQP